MKFPLFFILILINGTALFLPAANVESPSLTLEQAFEIAERLQPDIAEGKALIEAAEGRAKQAGVFPNPGAVGRAESVGIGRRTIGGAEYVTGVSQPIPLGGRLRKARAAEQLERDRRILDLEMRQRELRKSVHAAFATALYQEKALETRRIVADGASKFVDTTKARLDAGDIVREKLARAEMDLARAEVELRRADAMREHSMIELKAAIGDPGLWVKELTGNLDTTFEIPTLENLAANLSSHPEAASAEVDVRVQEAHIDLVKAKRIPDLRVESLYRRLEGTKEHSFDLGFSFSIPLFDRSRGRLREARAEAAAAVARSRSVQNTLRVDLHEVHAKLSAALANSSALNTQVLPRAGTVLQVAEARFEAGDISLAELLPVRRDWANVNLTYLESLRDVMRAWAELSPFLSQSMTKIQ